MEKQQKAHMCCFCRFPEFSSDYHSLAQKETINSGYCDTVYLGTIVAVIINSLINLIMRKRAWIKMQMKMSKLQMDDKCGIFISTVGALSRPPNRDNRPTIRPSLIVSRNLKCHEISNVTKSQMSRNLKCHKISNVMKCQMTQNLKCQKSKMS